MRPLIKSFVLAVAGGRGMGVGEHGGQTVKGFVPKLAWTFPTLPGRIQAMWLCGGRGMGVDGRDGQLLEGSGPNFA